MHHIRYSLRHSTPHGTQPAVDRRHPPQHGILPAAFGQYPNSTASSTQSIRIGFAMILRRPYGAESSRRPRFAGHQHCMHLHPANRQIKNRPGPIRIPAGQPMRIMSLAGRRGARGNSTHAMLLRQRHRHARARGNSTHAVPLHQRHRHARAGGRQHARARGRADSKLLLLVVVDGLELEQVLVALHGSLLILGEELLGTLGE